MGIIDNLKSLFIEEDGVDKPAESKKPDDKEKSQSPPKKAGSSHAVPSVSTAKKVNQRFLDTLLNALEENNLEGFDYLEFRQALRSLSKMNMDEATRFKSAFAMAQTMEVTPRGLVRTAKVYLDILSKEDKKFSEALANQEKTQLESRQTKVADLEASILTKQKQIESLMSDIHIHRNEMDKLNSELEEVHQKILGTKDNFTKTYTFLVDEIESDIKKMETYLK